MSDATKDTYLTLLQQRMDKCTNEQFWAVATATAFYAAIITGNDQYLNHIKSWLVDIALLIVAAYSVFFVIHRHIAYYDFRRDFSRIAQTCSNAPAFMKSERTPWRFIHCTGLIFYLLLIIGGFLTAAFLN